MKDTTKAAILRALMLSQSREEAAKIAGVSTRTIREALTLPDVQEALRAHNEALTLETTHTLAGAQFSAVAILRTIAEKENNPAYVRINAAKALLELSLRFADLADVEARLRALEERAEL